jgi:hypothetical protein
MDTPCHATFDDSGDVSGTRERRDPRASLQPHALLARAPHWAPSASALRRRAGPQAAAGPWSMAAALEGIGAAMATARLEIDAHVAACGAAAAPRGRWLRARTRVQRQRYNCASLSELAAAPSQFRVAARPYRIRSAVRRRWRGGGGGARLLRARAAAVPAPAHSSPAPLTALQWERCGGVGRRHVSLLADLDIRHCKPDNG